MWFLAMMIINKKVELVGVSKSNKMSMKLGTRVAPVYQ